MEWQESRSGNTRRSWDHRSPSRGSLMALPAGKGMQTTPAMIGNTPIHVSIMSIDAFGREATPRNKGLAVGTIAPPRQANSEACPAAVPTPPPPVPHKPGIALVTFNPAPHGGEQSERYPIQPRLTTARRTTCKKCGGKASGADGTAKPRPPASEHKSRPEASPPTPAWCTVAKRASHAIR